MSPAFRDETPGCLSHRPRPKNPGKDLVHGSARKSLQSTLIVIL